MRNLQTTEIAAVAGGLRATSGGIHGGVATPDVINIPGGDGVTGGIFTTIYNAIKYANWTPTEIAQDLFTAPGSTMTMTECAAVAGDLVVGVAALDAYASSQLGTYVYDNMSPSLQDAIGGTVDAAIDRINAAWRFFVDD